MAPNGANPRGIKSDETLFALVERIRGSDGVGVTELANATGLAKSTVHGHLSTMRDHGFVVRRDGEYYLGLEFFAHGHDARTQHDVYATSLSALDELAAETGETAWLMTHENGRVIYLDGRGNGTAISVPVLVGSWANMHANSGGKAILAHLPPEEVGDVVDRHGLPAMTDATITDRSRLDEELERVRGRGFALNLGEDLRGIHAVAVPLFAEGTVAGALAVAGPAHRVDRGRCTDELADRLQAAADEVELGLAYR